MAGPGGREVGRVSIRVLPNTSSFGASLEKYLQRVEHTLRLELPVSLDQASVKETEAELALLTRDRNINIDIDTNTLEKELTSAAEVGERGFGRMALIIGAVTLAVGALVEALPAAILLFGAPIAAIAAGWEGIKKVFSGLADEMKALKTSVSDVFVGTLGPAIKDLKKLFPVLQDGLGSIASSIGHLFGDVIATLTSPESLAQITSILASVQQFIDAISPAVQPFIQAFLKLADAGAKVAVALSPQFVSLVERFAAVIQKMAADGSLQKSMEGLGHAILVVVFAFTAIVLGAAIVIGWLERLGESFSRANQRLVRAWQGIPAVIRSITAPIGRLISNIVDVFTRGNARMVKAWNGIPGLFRGTLSFFRKLPGQILGFIKSLPSRLGSLGKNAATSFDTGITGVLDKLVSKVRRKIDDIVSAFQRALRINSPSKVFMDIGSSVGEGFQIGMEKSFRDVTASASFVTDSTIQAARASTFGSADTSPLPSGPIRVWVDNVNHFDARSERVANGVLADASQFAGVMGRMA